MRTRKEIEEAMNKSMETTPTLLEIVIELLLDIRDVEAGTNK
jgi:hypothetical protein